jgi:hypothetical protein
MSSFFRRWSVPCFAVLASLALAPKAIANDDVVLLPQGPLAPQTMDQLVRMSANDLTALYLASPVAAPPQGFAPGKAIKNPGSRRTVFNSRVTGVAWQGKIFRDDGTMINRMFGCAKLIPAEVYVGPSLLDGQPSLILDYSKSKLWPDVRDEVREVSPGLYLGIMYRGKSEMKQTMFFTLDARK